MEIKIAVRLGTGEQKGHGKTSTSERGEQSSKSGLKLECCDKLHNRHRSAPENNRESGPLRETETLWSDQTEVKVFINEERNQKENRCNLKFQPAAGKKQKPSENTERQNNSN